MFRPDQTIINIDVDLFSPNKPLKLKHQTIICRRLTLSIPKAIHAHLSLHETSGENSLKINLESRR